MNKEQYLVVVSGPSGSGKDTVVNRLRELHPEIQISISATTRGMRPGEAEGINYYYLQKEEFERRIEQDEILEYTQYCGNYYGTPKAEVDRRIAQKQTVILVIEIEGAANIKRIYPDSTSVFVCPPSFEELEKRLRGRGTESEEAIQKRMARAHEEMKLADRYDEVVVNENINVCAEQLYAMIKKHQQD